MKAKYPFLSILTRPITIVLAAVSLIITFSIIGVCIALLILNYALGGEYPSSIEWIKINA